MADNKQYGRFADIWMTHGRVYVTSQGYVQAHIYTSNKVLADYVVNRTNCRCDPHSNVYDVAITSRKSLRLLSQALLKQELAEQHRKLLVLVYRYATVSTKVERQALADRIKLLLKSTRNPVVPHDIAPDVGISSSMDADTALGQSD